MKDWFIENINSKLSEIEFKSLYLKMKQGDKLAREKLIINNISIVLDVVSKKFFYSKIEKSDLVSIGLIGLIKSVDTYSLSKNATFYTYSFKCILNEIYMFFNSLKRHNFDEIVYAENKYKLESDYESVSSSEQVDVIYEQKEKYKIIRESIDNLPLRDSIIIKKYFGFNCTPMSQKDIAIIYGVSQSYVSKIIKKSLKIIKRNLEVSGYASEYKLLKKIDK